MNLREALEVIEVYGLGVTKMVVTRKRTEVREALRTRRGRLTAKEWDRIEKLLENYTHPAVAEKVGVHKSTVARVSSGLLKRPAA